LLLIKYFVSQLATSDLTLFNASLNKGIKDGW